MKPYRGKIKGWIKCKYNDGTKGNFFIGSFERREALLSRTSKVVSIDGRRVETLNSIYLLGRPASNNEKGELSPFLGHWFVD